MILRLRTLWPLFGVYIGLVTLYAWQATQRKTPTLFSDEIEFTQVSRSIATTGRAALRGGEPAPDISLYRFLVAPAWWIDDVATAYGVIKVLGVVVMTAAIFPAYALARLVVSRRWALFAAAGTAAAPALAYSPFLVDEPLAYTVSTLALFLVARAGIRPTAGSIALALAVCVVAIGVRTQLAILIPILALVVAGRVWRSAWARNWRESWTRWDWVGAGTLLLGFILAVSALLGHRSYSWYVATTFFKSRMLEYGLWATGALAIGLGLFPLIGGLVALVWRRGEPADEHRETFVTLAASAIGVFGLYTAVKAAYLSTTLAVVIAERNLIYLVPLLFVGTAFVLERRRALVAPTVWATAFAVFLVTTTPYSLDRYPNYEAHGLAIAAFANRIPKWPAETIETVLVVVALGSGLSLLAVGFLRSARSRGAAAAVIAVVAVGWSLTTEIYAANGEHHASKVQYGALPLPPSWVDGLTGGERTALVGQGISDPNPIWQLEFWNRSIEYFMGLDGSAPGPGQTATPNLDDPDGTYAPADLNAEYAVAIGGVTLAAPKITTVGGMDLYRLGRRPVRLRETRTGVAPDGWMSERASYTRYVVDRGARRHVLVRFSREAACFPQLAPVTVTVALGPVGIGPDDQPTIERVTARGSSQLKPCLATAVLLPVPPQPWRAEVAVSKTFVPNELDANLGDRRPLGAVVAFEIGSS